MQILENNSFFIIRKNFDLSPRDMQVLNFLYLPIIKKNAFALYIALYNFQDVNNYYGEFIHEEMIENLGYSNSDFLIARNYLESIGLIEVYKKTTCETNNQTRTHYIYSLYPPASPKKFFNDVLLRTTLNNVIGNKRYYFYYNYFRVDEKVIDEDYNKITLSFNDMFTTNAKEGDISLLPIEKDLEEKKYKTQFEFDKDELKEKLKDLLYPFSAIKAQLKEIENITVLYQASIAQIVPLIIENTDSDGKFYLDNFNKSVRNLRQYSVKSKEVSQNSNYGGEFEKLYELLNTISPDELLNILFKAKPSKMMLDEIEKLKNDLHLPNPLINVVLHYSLKKTNNEFRVSFIDQVAYTLSSMDCKSVQEAMMKLNNRDYEANKAKSKKTYRRKEKINEGKKDLETVEEIKEVSKEEIDDFSKVFEI